MKPDCALFILLGQSNATGHDLPMAEEDKIMIPLRNVFGLQRSENQSYHNEKLRWSGYVSAGTNLAEEQDDTYSVSNCLARQWQDAIDSGADLPDLYILHISIGAQGISRHCMWYPDRPEKLIPGKLGKVDISLYPFTRNIFSLVDRSFQEMGKTYVNLGMHWRGGEEETEFPMRELRRDLMKLYRRMIADFRASLGDDTVAFIPHRIVCINRVRRPFGLQRLNYINECFDELAATERNVWIFDPRNAPMYDGSRRDSGLFRGDMVHFTREVNEWVASEILSDAEKRCRG